MSSLKIALAGVAGRMGRVLVEAVAANPATELSGALTRSGTKEIGLDAGYASGIDTGVLTQFEQAGILLRHHFETGKAVYELNKGDHHDHIVCVKCGNVSEFHNPEIEKLQEQIASEHGFRVVDHALYMYGVCGDCQKKEKR